MHQTKYTNVIINTLPFYFKQDLASIKFILLLNKYNNISVMKMLGVCAIYYSDSNNKVSSFNIFKTCTIRKL